MLRTIEQAVADFEESLSRGCVEVPAYPAASCEAHLARARARLSDAKRDSTTPPTER